MSFILALLELHPTLEFLKQHPTYQEKYSHTVIIRIFYYNDLNNDGKLSYREFRKSNLLNIIKKACEETDLNLIREYFSYDHFYVIYCVFWKLDNNDTVIDKEAFSRYVFL
jgi:serine/threonine-protein phosphatase 2A regulatory subunit B''